MSKVPHGIKKLYSQKKKLSIGIFDLGKIRLLYLKTTIPTV